ncbi:MAG: hypothetical protein HFG27_02235 [Provencibacterium sp.]|nr:hypothetical protein [Provencibacterium sp.]
MIISISLSSGAAAAAIRAAPPNTEFLCLLIEKAFLFGGSIVQYLVFRAERFGIVSITKIPGALLIQKAGWTWNAKKAYNTDISHFKYTKF